MIARWAILLIAVLCGAFDGRAELASDLKIATPPGFRVNDVMNMKDGYLVAVDGAELGGELRWISNDGARSNGITNGNFRYLRAVKNDVVAIGGRVEGAGGIWTARRGATDGSWTAERILEFQGAPVDVEMDGQGGLMITALNSMEGRHVERTIKLDAMGAITSVETRELDLGTFMAALRDFAMKEKKRTARFDEFENRAANEDEREK